MEVCYFGISAYPSAPRKVFDYHNVKFIIQIIIITNFLGTFVKHAQIKQWKLVSTKTYLYKYDLFALMFTSYPQVTFFLYLPDHLLRQF